MCYDIQAKLQSQLKRAQANGDHVSITEITEKLEKFLGKPLFHASGFSHPTLIIYPNTDKFVPIVATWGFIPEWVRTSQQAKDLWNSTLNARGETLFEKPSFREAALNKRCVVPIDGFFEHHHFQGKTYPYFIQRKDQEPINVAGLYSDWINPETGNSERTVSLVTKRGNALMGAIHNNPKLVEPRMPVMLNGMQTEDWLDAKSQLDVQEIIQQECTLALNVYPVQRLRGKAYVGNCPAVSDREEYPELSLIIP